MIARPLLLLIALTATTITAGCQPEEAPTLRVEICGDLLIPEELDAVRISVLDKDQNTLSAGTIELLQCPAATLLTLPQTFQVNMPEDNLWIRAQGIHQGIEVITDERRIRSAKSGTLVRLGLSRDCLGITCALGQTCVQSFCRTTPFQDGYSPCQSRPTEDMGQDPTDLTEDINTDADINPDTPDTDIPDAEPDQPSLCPPSEAP